MYGIIVNSDGSISWGLAANDSEVQTHFNYGDCATNLNNQALIPIPPAMLSCDDIANYYGIVAGSASSVLSNGTAGSSVLDQYEQQNCSNLLFQPNTNMTCGQLAAEYGITVDSEGNVTNPPGTVNSIALQGFVNNDCATNLNSTFQLQLSPFNPFTCAQMANNYNIQLVPTIGGTGEVDPSTGDVSSYGTAGASIQAAWSKNNCSSTLAPTSATCQQLMQTYGITINPTIGINWGNAANNQTVQNQFALGGCSVNANNPTLIPVAANQFTCSALQKGYGIQTGVGISGTPAVIGSGTASATAIQAWNNLGCSPLYMPNPSSSLSCSQLNNQYGIDIVNGEVSNSSNINAAALAMFDGADCEISGNGTIQVPLPPNTMTCNQMQTGYGIQTGILPNNTLGVTSWGTAGPNTQANWNTAACTASSLPTATCTEIQTAYDISLNDDGTTNYAGAPSNIQTAWNAQSCNSGLISDLTCQEMMNMYNIQVAADKVPSYLSSTGTASGSVMSQWNNQNCTSSVVPNANIECSLLQDEYDIIIDANDNITWGTAPSTIQTAWNNANCTSNPQMALPSCQQLITNNNLSTDINGNIATTTNGGGNGGVNNIVQQQWNIQNCPKQYAGGLSCAEMTSQYNINSNSSNLSTAYGIPQSIINQYLSGDCTTNQKGTWNIPPAPIPMSCSELQTNYSIQTNSKGGVSSWGSAGPSVTNAWNDYYCSNLVNNMNPANTSTATTANPITGVPGTPPGLSCRQMYELYNYYTTNGEYNIGQIGNPNQQANAPPAIQALWNANNCATNSSSTSTIPMLPSNSCATLVSKYGAAPSPALMQPYEYVQWAYGNCPMNTGSTALINADPGYIPPSIMYNNGTSTCQQLENNNNYTEIINGTKSGTIDNSTANMWQEYIPPGGTAACYGQAPNYDNSNTIPLAPSLSCAQLSARYGYNSSTPIILNGHISPAMSQWVSGSCYNNPTSTTPISAPAPF